MLRCIARGIGFGGSHSRVGSLKAAAVPHSTSRVATPLKSGRTLVNHVNCSAILGCMKASLSSAALPALTPQHRLFWHGASMPRCQLRTIHQRRTASNAAYSNSGCREEGCCTTSSCNQRKQQRQTSSARHSTAAHAAAAAGTWDSPHSDQQHIEEHSLNQEQGQSTDHRHPHRHSSSNSCCGGARAHFHTHNGHHHHDHHHHDHHNGHGHHHHHHHFHSDAAASSSNPLISILGRSGMFRLADHLERHTAYTVTSISCFIAAMLMPYAAAQGLLQVGTAALLSKLALAVTYVLSGIPQLVETVGAAATGKVDTHVLMSLSIVGTLYMGMAHEGALLLLLFRVSHLLEDRLTEKAAGSLQRLFDSVPDSAAVVEVEDNGAPRVSTTQQVAASSVSIGQHVLVRPGEQVPLDGVIVWGTANLSLQHITGEEQPVKFSPGQEVPAGSLSTDGLLVVRVEASAEDSTPARIARLAAEAQAQRPQLTRWLDSVGAVWTKAVIGATLMTAVVLPLLGVPFWGDRGALYRAMGVLTAGSPCALALVPLAYACAIAAITARGILIKSGAALDALAACQTIALDKTGTITTGSLNLAEGYVLHLNPAAHTGNSSSSSEWPDVRSISGLADLCKIVASGGSEAALGGRTQFASAFDSDDYSAHTSPTSSTDSGVLGGSGQVLPFDQMALKCAVALSRLSNHPVSRAMVECAPHIDGDVAVLSFEQVPGAGVEGLCRVGHAEPVHVRFGAADWINGYLTDSNAVAGVNKMLVQHTDRPSRATALLAISPLLGRQPSQQQQKAATDIKKAPVGVTYAAAASDAETLSEAASDPDMAVTLDDGSSTLSSSSGDSSRRSSMAGISRPVSPSKFVGSHGNVDGSTTYEFDFEDADLLPQEAAEHPHPSAAITKPAAAALAQQQPQAGIATASQEVPLHLKQQQHGSPGQPDQLMLLCFEDVIQSGVPAAVQQLQNGSWSSRWGSGSSRWLLGNTVAAAKKDIVMLTGDNQRVAAAVAGAIGITDYKAGLKPEDKLAYVTQAAAAAASSKGGSSGGQGLLMAGDGINDAPALAAAQVGVAIASSPKDMVSAAADIIVLNGQGITNLPWLFSLADKTHSILQQNLALAVASVAVATLPTIAGMFPLWLAVTLHEGSTVLVALNSLRLLLGATGSSNTSGSSSRSGSSIRKSHHHGDHDHDEHHHDHHH